MADTTSNITGNATNGTDPSKPVIPPEGQALAYSALYLMALASIYFGSFRSLAFVRKHQKENKKIENSISFNDAKWFPITASSVLFGLYLLFKMDQLRHWATLLAQKASPFLPEHVSMRLFTLIGNVSANGTALSNRTTYIAQVIHNATGYQPPTLTKEHLSYFLLIFFCYEGVFAMGHLAKPLVKLLMKMIMLNRIKFFQNRHYQLLFLRSGKELPEFSGDGRQSGNRKRTHSEKAAVNDGSADGGSGKNSEEGKGEEVDAFLDWHWDKDDIISVLLCSVVGIIHVTKRNWITNNAFGLAFSLFGIEALHLGSFKAGVMLLAGLFIYDIFWVFATDVMSTVATSVNAPILLMFPQDILINGFKANKYAMLGLGDIVIPGVFLALLLRYGEKTKKRSYFYATLGAYSAGLIITIGVMHYFKAAQPALLYLVPTCVGVPSVLALIKGDWTSMAQYTEEHLVKQPDKEKKKDQQKKTDGGAGGKGHGKKDTKKSK